MCHGVARKAGKGIFHGVRGRREGRAEIDLRERRERSVAVEL
jgi:hypothetical protein